MSLVVISLFFYTRKSPDADFGSPYKHRDFDTTLLNAQGGIKADSAFAFMLSVFAKFLLGSFDAESISDQGSNL